MPGLRWAAFQRVNEIRATSDCENERADWENDFPRLCLDSVHCLQNGGHDADSSVDEEISQHIKLRHHDQHQDGSTKRHQTLDDTNLEKTHTHTHNYVSIKSSSQQKDLRITVEMNKRNNYNSCTTCTGAVWYNTGAFKNYNVASSFFRFIFPNNLTHKVK